MLAAVRVIVITDRRHGDLIAKLRAIASAVPRGSVLVQVREKDLDGGPLFALVQQVLAVARPAGMPVWLNDRADIAIASEVDGLHLPEQGLTIKDARLAGWNGLIGCSRHAPVAVDADLIQLGPIWATPSKDRIMPLGTGALNAARGTAKLVAVGGIDSPGRARAAIDAGADAVAVIRAAWTTSDPGSSVAALVAAVGTSRDAAAQV